MSGAYMLSSRPMVLAHGPAAHGFVNDFADNPDNLEIAAMVASGDCFDTLATRLDQLSLSFDRDSPEHAEAERLIRALLYLQQNYTIKRQHSRADW